MCTVEAGATSHVPRPPTSATMAVTPATRASPLSAITAPSIRNGIVLAEQVAEAAVQHRRERDADQALGITRADAGRVQVARDDVDDLDHPHHGGHRGDQYEPADTIAGATRRLAQHGSVVRHAPQT